MVKKIEKSWREDKRRDRDKIQLKQLSEEWKRGKNNRRKRNCASPHNFFFYNGILQWRLIIKFSFVLDSFIRQIRQVKACQEYVKLARMLLASEIHVSCHGQFSKTLLSLILRDDGFWKSRLMLRPVGPRSRNSR